MKNIKLRIVYLILGAALLLFALFMLAVNVVIPAHFVSEAEKALRNEAQYENRTIPYTYEGEVYDDDWDDGAEEHFFTPSIVFLELENGYQPNTWSQDTYRLEKKLLAYCSERSVAPNRCHDFKADKHHLIFMPVQEDYGNSEKPYSYIMYIDIGPITRYIVTLNWAFFGVLLAISSVMCLLGFRFGRDIEKEAERQQTFFQNASHELKTPLMAIQGYAEGIQAGVMDAGGAAEVILEESDRMTELVEELLDISKNRYGAAAACHFRDGCSGAALRQHTRRGAGSRQRRHRNRAGFPRGARCGQLRRYPAAQSSHQYPIQRRALCPQSAAPDLPHG